jgi:hypothetical protein
VCERERDEREREGWRRGGDGPGPEKEGLPNCLYPNTTAIYADMHENKKPRKKAKKINVTTWRGGRGEHM